MKDKIIRYSVTMGVGLGLALIVSFSKQLYWQTDVVKIMRCLCDCFTVPGLLFILFGLLVVCSNGGTFDMLGFGCKKFISLFKSEKKRQENKQNFYEYRQQKQKKKRSFWYLIICGAVYLVIGIIFLIIFYNV